jgi:hypothetical protein
MNGWRKEIKKTEERKIRFDVLVDRLKEEIFVKRKQEMRIF